MNSLRDMFVREEEFLLDCHRTSSWPQLDTRGRDSQFSNSVKASFCLSLRETFESRLLIVSGVVDGVVVAPTGSGCPRLVLACLLHALISNRGHVVKNATLSPVLARSHK